MRKRAGETGPKTGATSARLLAALLVGTAVLHFARPQTFDESIPRQLPGRNRTWVYLAGAALFIAGLAVAKPDTRRFGALAAAAIFVAVFPANLHMVEDATSAPVRVALIARLPLQIPLVAWALEVARATSMK